MKWTVIFEQTFQPEFMALAEEVQDELLAGNKAGTSENRFYKQLIAKADARFTTHLARLS